MWSETNFPFQIFIIVYFRELKEQFETFADLSFASAEDGLNCYGTSKKF